MITTIVALDNNNVIGNNNELIWHLPNDLKRFKELTTGHPIIMGRKTFESIGKPLPNRTNIIITNNQQWKKKGTIVIHSLEEAIKYAKTVNENVFIIGGSMIYDRAIHLSDILEVTEIKHSFSGDAYFPIIDLNIWKETSRIKNKSDNKHLYAYDFVKYEKSTNNKL